MDLKKPTKQPHKLFCVGIPLKRYNRLSMYNALHLFGDVFCQQENKKTKKMESV